MECPVGYYSLGHPVLSAPIYECTKCSSEAECLGGSKISVNPGYWRINDQSYDIIECSNAS